jgi:hypothetical protein
MNRPWRSRSIYRRLLVLVLAAQMLTPDCSDLVSTSLSRLLLLFNSVGLAIEVGADDVALPDPAGGDPSFPDSASADEMGNQVGLPCGRSAGMALQRRGGGTRRPALHCFGSIRHWYSLQVPRLSLPEGSDFPSADPLVRFARLIC